MEGYMLWIVSIMKSSVIIQNLQVVSLREIDYLHQQEMIS